MKEWVENHLLTEKKDKLSARRINEKWFTKNGFTDQYNALLLINPDLTLACKIVLGLTKQCKCCDNIIVLPRVYCSTKCQVNDPDFKELKKQTMLSKYGVENAFSKGQLREQFEQKNLDVYGSRFPISTEEIREKAKQTCLINHGVEYSLQSKIIQNKTRESILEKYGVDNPQKVDYIREKTIETNLLRYGFDTPSKNEDVKQKSISTSLIKYGVEHSSKLPETQNKKIETNLKLYGVEQANQAHYPKELLKAIDNKLVNVIGTNDSIFDNISIKTIYNLLNKYRPDLVKDNISMGHRELTSHIKNLYPGQVLDNQRGILGGQEIDIFIPELNLGFEFNGTYWHSDLFKDKKYHQSKSLLAKEKGIKLIHLYEYDGLEKNKRIISNILTKNSNRMFARKCVIKEITKDEEKDFLNKNHRYYSSRASFRVGLYYQDKLVQVMTFSKPRFNKNYEWELIRMCSLQGTTIVGGASRLIRYFINDQNPSSILTYSHLDNGFNTVYEKIGFKYEGISKPSYKWVKDNEILSRYQTQILNENKYMKEQGYLKIYNSGNEVFTWKRY